MPFFFDLSSLIPTVERNPFKPVIVPDAIAPVEPAEAETADAKEIPAEPIVDTGLPIPSHYDFDLMHALVQDPFRLFVYWQLKDNPFDRLPKIFPKDSVDTFHTVLKLIDETNNISVFVDAAFTNEYWFSVYPDRAYRVEIGLRSARHGYIKLLSSQTAITPRGGPSDQIADEADYRISSNDYLKILRESHHVPERAYTLDGLLPGGDAATAAARNGVWEALPSSFRRLMQAIADVHAGRHYDRWWERLGQEESAGLVREFLEIIRQMGDGEMGYQLLLRYLPELLRRAIQAESEAAGVEMQIDKPISLYLAEKLGQSASEMNINHAPENLPERDRWAPSLSS